MSQIQLLCCLRLPCRHSRRSGEESELLLTGGSLYKGEGEGYKIPWQGRQELNLRRRSQSPVCDHHTAPLYVACLSKLPFRTGAQVIPPHGALRAILADFEALLSHQALFCVGQDVSCTYGNWRPTLARTLGNRTQHTGFWRPRRHLGTFARIYALPTFQPERRGVRAATYGRQLVEKEKGRDIKSRGRGGRN